MPDLEFWCEIASTYTYLAAHRIDRVAADAGVNVVWRPFSLGPIFADVGWQTSPFEIYPVKGRHMWRDVEREAERLDAPFARPSAFPRNTVLAARVALLGVQRGWGAAFVRAALHANFAEDRDVASPQVVDELLAELGIDGPSTRDEVEHGTARPLLRAATNEARSRGIFGAPTFFSGDEMFWGNDRLERAIEWTNRGR